MVSAWVIGVRAGVAGVACPATEGIPTEGRVRGLAAAEERCAGLVFL